MGSPLRSLNDYFRRLNDLLSAGSWTLSEEAAKLLSIGDAHVQMKFLQLERAENERRLYLNNSFDEVACLHLAVIYHLSKEHFENAFNTHVQVVQLFNKEILQKEKDQNWFLPILYTLCTDLRLLARSADNKPSRLRDPEKSSCYEQSATYIMECYRTCVADVRAEIHASKKMAMLNLTNQLFRIYFRINKLNLLKPLIRAIDNSGPLYQTFSMADKVTYKYYLGRKAMFDSDLSLSEKSLSYAFRNCPSHCARNKRLILIYLVPVKMFLGHMPSIDLLKRYQLQQFATVVESVKDGNLKKLDETLMANERFFVECGIFLMLEKLKIIAFRNLFKKVTRIYGTNQISYDAFMCAIRWLGIEDMDEDELECILANLIVEKKIKGYLSHMHKKLVISKQNPFPALSTLP
uniref:PCI domain-containing protein 2 homolog n=1 Tax=Setaria digitata TaxID=48799 RepID=A0A915PKL6_9BILA